MVDKQKLFAGVDIGGQWTKIAISDSKGKILHKSRIQTLKEKGPVQTLERSRDELCRFGGSFCAVCIGVPGTLPKSRDEIAFAPNLPGWSGFPIKKSAEDVFGIPVFVENDSNLATFGEYHAYGRKFKTLCAFTLGTGVGGGLVIRRKLFKGTNGYAAEFGHMIIQKDGEQCGCGSRGCLEAYASERALLKIAERHGIRNVSAMDIFKFAERDDIKFCKIVNEYCANLAAGILSIVRIVDPDAVVISGGLSLAGKILQVMLMSHLSENSMGQTRIRVLIGKLGGYAGAIGAAHYARECSLPEKASKKF